MKKKDLIYILLACLVVSLLGIKIFIGSFIGSFIDRKEFCESKGLEFIDSGLNVNEGILVECSDGLYYSGVKCFNDDVCANKNKWGMCENYEKIRKCSYYGKFHPMYFK